MINYRFCFPFGYWQAIANTFHDPRNLRMKVLSEKHKELSQTMASLSNAIRMEKGCNRCDFCQNVEDENRLFLLEEWDAQENLTTLEIEVF